VLRKAAPLDPVDAKVREDHAIAIRENREASKRVRLATQALRWIIEHPKGSILPALPPKAS